MDSCRDTFGTFNVTVFQLWSCSMCFHYLFHNKTALSHNWNMKSPRLLHSNAEIVELKANVSDDISVHNICSYLDKQGCDQWISCCRSAISCCNEQVQEMKDIPKKNGSLCPMTWDGFGCFQDTPRNNIAQISCPRYIKYGLSSGFAKKHCTSNGTWWTDHKSGKEWTDYTDCMQMHTYMSIVHVGIVCGSMSILLLLPACIILLSFRQLRQQNRIRLHLCLFLSLLVSSIITMSWDIIIYKDRLENPLVQTVISKNTVPCRMLYFLKRYTRTCIYFWMFCEAFYLHRLMVQAFKVPRSLFWYYVFGWGCSLLPITVYTTIKVQIADGSCWIKQIGQWEWIVYAPNLLCIVSNFFFLGNILRILLTQIHIHPNEPNHYRRAIRATFVLIPLFGVQLFLVIYRPAPENFERLSYELISKLIIDSQGIIVSLVFCFCNGEVMGYLKPTLSCIKKTSQENGLINAGSLTMYSSAQCSKTYKPKHKNKRTSNLTEYIGLQEKTNL